MHQLLWIGNQKSGGQRRRRGDCRCLGSGGKQSLSGGDDAVGIAPKEEPAGHGRRSVRFVAGHNDQQRLACGSGHGEHPGIAGGDPTGVFQFQRHAQRLWKERITHRGRGEHTLDGAGDRQARSIVEGHLQPADDIDRLRKRNRRHQMHRPRGQQEAGQPGRACRQRKGIGHDLQIGKCGAE